MSTDHHNPTRPPPQKTKTPKSPEAKERPEQGRFERALRAQEARRDGTQELGFFSPELGCCPLWSSSSGKYVERFERLAEHGLAKCEERRVERQVLPFGEDRPVLREVDKDPKVARHARDIPRRVLRLVWDEVAISPILASLVESALVRGPRFSVEIEIGEITHQRFLGRSPGRFGAFLFGEKIEALLCGVARRGRGLKRAFQEIAWNDERVGDALTEQKLEMKSRSSRRALQTNELTFG